MSKTVTPPVPERTEYTCDRCNEAKISPRVHLNVAVDDYQGQPVAGREMHLCQSCRADLMKWINAGVELK